MFYYDIYKLPGVVFCVLVQPGVFQEGLFERVLEPFCHFYGVRFATLVEIPFYEQRPQGHPHVGVHLEHAELPPGGRLLSAK